MATDVALVFPHQLFDRHPAVTSERPIAVVEEPLFFNDSEWPLAWHRQKLLFHRQSIDAWVEQQGSRGHRVQIFSATPTGRRKVQTSPLGAALKGKNAAHVCELADDVLTRRLTAAAREANCNIVWYPSPGFLLDQASVEAELGDRKRFFMARFYESQRRRHNILLDGDSPVGGKWSFDAENRKKLPRNISVPGTKLPATDPDKTQIAWLKRHFSHCHGSVDDFWWPSTREDALSVLDNFIDERFRQYGDFQDAITREHVFVFHSVISPFLNAGLLTPDEVVSRALQSADGSAIPFNALEGFIRQMIGWREYVRGVYELKGGFQRSQNFFGFSHALPDAMREGRTGIDPFDAIVKRVESHSWCHHIERLMVLGNFMLLTETDPDAVYDYFMANFVDAWDWVMVPNVYGMSQFADGGMMCTKPYISGSNYIKKMSNFGKGDWCDVWDALFWRFIAERRELFKANPRSAMMVRNLDRMDAGKRSAHLKTAERYLKSLH